MIKVFHGSFENELEILYTKFHFPGGELQVRFNPDEEWNSSNVYTVLWHYENDAELMEVALLTDALLEAAGVHLKNGDKELTLFLELPYLPYARQDRVCSPGEALALRSFACLINALCFDLIRCSDPHNEGVFRQLFEYADIVNQAECCLQILTEKDMLVDAVDILLFPDEGSYKKINQYYELFDEYGMGLAKGSKIRDPLSGTLRGFDIDVKDFHGANVLIVDDICDGGGTFIGLGEVAKARNCGKLYLYTTHGIYSKGMESLNQMFDGVFCYNNMFERKMK